MDIHEFLNEQIEEAEERAFVKAIGIIASLIFLLLTVLAALVWVAAG